MWMAILKSQITGMQSEKRSKNAKKNNNLLKTKRRVNTEIQGKWGPGLCILLASGAVRSPSPRQLRH